MMRPSARPPSLMRSMRTTTRSPCIASFEVRRRRCRCRRRRLERPLRRDEAVAGRVGLQPADDEVHLFGQAEALPADLNEIAGRDERLDVPLERRPLVLRHLEELQQLAHGGGMVHPLAHQREDLIA